jgi:hypothetical protein
MMDACCSIQSNLPILSAEGGASAISGFPSEIVAPQPIKIVNLPYERAHVLATLPRRKWDEWTWAALGGAIAACPSAADAIIVAFKTPPVSFGIFQTIQISIFVGFLVWFFVSRAYSKGSKTAAEYLYELYSLPQEPLRPRRSWQFWKD